MDNKQQTSIYYGTKAPAPDLIEFLDHVMKANLENIKQNKKKSPVCIWGDHGIGKTQIVEDYAKKNGFEFRYIAPAQFEEMGDLVGMPRGKDEHTVFLPPEWVPSSEGPGILLIDDVNRADDRILRGIMQLLQNFELVSWKLPEKWQIVLTANPDGGDYSVTSMDDAMITRMLHITLDFDIKAWALWAEENGIDERGINFILTYPEVVSGKRTTPRTIVQFFDSISQLQDLEDNIGLVQILADAALDKETGAAFIAFVRNNLSRLITPSEILSAKDFKKEVYNVIKKVAVKDTLRVDILSTLCTRLMNHIHTTKEKFTKKAAENLAEFFQMDFLPNDLRLMASQEIASSKKPAVKELLANPAVGKLLLSKM